MTSQPTQVESQPTAADRAELMPLLINEVLTEYLQMRGKAIAKTISLGDRVLSRWMAAKGKLEQENRAYGNLFNPLRIIDAGETTHSDLVGELLNPKGSHGQGELFLVSFLTLIGVPEPAAGGWAVTVEKGRIDILLRRLNPSSVVIIENKSNYAIDQKNQLYRYWFYKIYSPYPKLDYKSEVKMRSYKIVYLTPDSSKEPVNQSLERPPDWPAETCPHECIPIKLEILPYQKLMRNWLADSEGMISSRNVRLTTFLQFYAELWQPL